MSKKEPCPICHKTDWCNLSDDGAVVICHRVESGKLAKSGSGWIHRLREVNSDVSEATLTLRHSGSKPRSCGAVARATTIGVELDYSRIHRAFDADPVLIEGLATMLGVDDEVLKAMDVRYNWTDECWSFPMRDAEGKVVGLRYRELCGSRKWSAKGSRDGLFVSSRRGVLAASGSGTPPGALRSVPFPNAARTPRLLGEGLAPRLQGECSAASGSGTPRNPTNDISHSLRELVIVEGASDTAAALSLGLNAVGRSSCQTGAALLRKLIRRVRPRLVTIVADNDAPGIAGAELLAEQLTEGNSAIHNSSFIVHHSPVPVRVLVVPHPYKDLRAWYVSGKLTAKLFADLASAQRFEGL